MKKYEDVLAPDPKGFEVDPIGYSALSWQKWGMAQTVAGFPVDITRTPTARDLKSPVLWLTQAHALSEAAVNVIRNEPNLDHITVFTKGVCHSQYHAVALMLVGLSLEICLKSMLIIREGIDDFTTNERTRRHHRLNKLAEFIPNLTKKDCAILECLTHFIYWAGKYPDPGSGREKDTVELFEISEEHAISARQLFELTSRIMGYVEVLVSEDYAG